VPRETTSATHPDLSGLYLPAGLEVQPCGRNEWMRRSFETDTFCDGDDGAFPFTAAGRERWKTYNVIDDPVLGCVEDFPRTAMRGRPMKISLGEELTEIAYWFNNEWFVPADGGELRWKTPGRNSHPERGAASSLP
jgi:hypothetical protein